MAIIEDDTNVGHVLRNIWLWVKPGGEREWEREISG